MLSTLICLGVIEGIIHNVILVKVVIRRFLKYFRNKHRSRKQFWQYFEVGKDYNILIKEEHMFFFSIIMSYKENCKAEGEIMAKFKIARMYFAEGKKQINISKYLKCHQNTINNIIKACRQKIPSDEAWTYLNDSKLHIDNNKLLKLFSFLEYESRCPRSHKLSIARDSEAEKIINRFEAKKTMKERDYSNTYKDKDMTKRHIL